MKLPNISIEQFYKVGILCFFLSAIGQIWSLSYNWNLLFIGNKLTAFANIFFNLFLAYFFYTLYKQTKPVNNEVPKDIINNEDIKQYTQTNNLQGR